MTGLRERMHSVALRMLSDEAEADDAVQDAYCNLLGAREPLTTDETRFRLFAILRNVCLNKLRQRRPNVNVDVLSGVSTPAVEPDDTPGIQRLLLESLPDSQRRVFELATFEELEYSEIADRLNMSTEAVRMNMSRARRHLREEYKRLKL
ncbi:MAG: sigma-70 family RNA polymerase sigma factor [Bacteroides sp.]|nr:sigma-70 family RNA polymerase sigma factor [Bacteroides sp.]